MEVTLEKGMNISRFIQYVDYSLGSNTPEETTEPNLVEKEEVKEDDKKEVTYE